MALLTRPDDEEVLDGFYRKVRPGGWWGPVARGAPDVVDDGSNAEHRSVMREFTEPYPFIYLEKEQGGLAAARNLGAERAGGEILYFLDDDVMPGPGTLSQHIVSHERAQDPVAVVGSLPFAAGIERSPFLWYLERSGHYDLYEIPDKYSAGRPPLPPLNGNSSVRR